MKKITLILTFILMSITRSFACCAEIDYRLFPVGEWEQQVIFIEFDLSRNCRKGTVGEDDIEFWVQGKVNLVQHQSDSLVVIHKVDSIKFKECICNYKNYYSNTVYEALLAKSYQKALNVAQHKKGFEMAIPKEIIFNDSLNTTLTEKVTDSSFSYILKYGNKLSVHLDLENIISCYPDKVAEVRTYETAHNQITVVRLRCRFIDQEVTLRNQKRFKKIKTAFWKEEAQWHGKAKDYWIIESKNP